MKNDLTAQQILESVEQKLSGGWCQNSFALDSKGRDVDYNDSAAVAYCLRGAINSTAGIEGRNRAVAIQHLQVAIQEKLGANASLITYNDDYATSQDEVLSVVRRARELADATTN
jgi:hypothetical protein